MKKIIFTLCFLIALVTVAHSLEFQKCIDKDGNITLTNNYPTPDVKCESTGIESIRSTKDKPDQTSSDKQKEDRKQDNLSNNEETTKRRIQNCVACCNSKKQVYLNISPVLRMAEALLEECITNCQSEGKSPAEWSDCWIKSEKPPEKTPEEPSEKTPEEPPEEPHEKPPELK